MTTGRQSPVRWALLLAVIAGIFAMHVLTPGDGPGHGSLPTAAGTHDGMTAEPMAEPVMAPEGFVTAWAAPPPMSQHGDMAGCILFLVVGGAALILLLLRYRAGSGTAGLGRLAGIAVTDMRRRGPPDRWPRLALCVIRV